MPPLGLSAGLRKAGELGRRALSPALPTPRMVKPTAGYRQRPHDGVLVLQRGENPSTDYYLRPRLVLSHEPACFADIESQPSRCALLDPEGPRSLLVIICRYVSEPWLNALDRMGDRLTRVAFFMDDDLPEMVRDPALPAAARGKAALHFADHVDRLGGLCSEVWVSTPALADSYPEASPIVLGPLPEDDPPPPAPAASRRVVYHGTDVHPRERAFVLDVARRLAAAGSDAEVEIVGEARLRRSAADLSNVRVIPQLPWPEHRRRQCGAPAAVCLAPLQPSRLNAARAPVKAFDAARLGAAGLYADTPPYQGYVRDGADGLLLPMDPDAWTAAIMGLLADSRRRLALANAARTRVAALRAAGSALPTPPGA